MRDREILKAKVGMLFLSANLLVVNLAFRNTCAFVLRDFSGSRLRVTCFVSKLILANISKIPIVMTAACEAASRLSARNVLPSPVAAELE